MQASRDAREAQVDERRKLREAQEEAKVTHAKKRALIEQICGLSGGATVQASPGATSRAAIAANTEQATDYCIFELPKDLKEYCGDPDDRCSILFACSLCSPILRPCLHHIELLQWC
jgi:hypothetical protein